MSGEGKHLVRRRTSCEGEIVTGGTSTGSVGRAKTAKRGYICTFKNTQIFELLKPFLESLHQTVFFGWNQYIGTLILALSAFPRSVLWEVNTGPDLKIDLGPLTV